MAEKIEIIFILFCVPPARKINMQTLWSNGETTESAIGRNGFDSREFLRYFLNMKSLSDNLCRTLLHRCQFDMIPTVYPH